MILLSRRAATIVEVLVVMGIITLLVAILVPSLNRARAQARTAKCLANVTNLYRGIEAFRVDHRGRAQLTANGLEEEWLLADPSQQIFAYERNTDASGRRQGLPWAIAYGPYVGEAGLTRAIDMFTLLSSPRPTPEEQRRLRARLLRTYGEHPIFQCPSDSIGVNRTWSPQGMVGVFSYGVNEDICGFSRATETDGPWAFGSPSYDTPSGRRVRRLEGRMENVFQPSQVVLIGDVGGEDRMEPALHNSDRTVGPYLEHVQARWGRLPSHRHGRDGKVAFAFVDGHAQTVAQRPLPGGTGAGYPHPNYQYVPRVRVSPFPPFAPSRQ